MARRRVRFPAKTAVLIMIIAAIAIYFIWSQDINPKIFFPIALGVFFLMIIAFGMNLYAKRKFKFFIWGMKALKFKKYEDSIINFTEFLEYYKNDPQIEKWKKMALGIRLTSVEAMTYFYRGVANYQNNLIQNALDDFENSAEISPDFEEAKYDCAIASAKLGKNKQALIWLSKIKNPPQFLVNKAKTAEEFEKIRTDKIFKKFISEKS